MIFLSPPFLAYGAWTLSAHAATANLLLFVSDGLRTLRLARAAERLSQ